MVKKAQPHLLMCFLKDKVKITTNLMSTIQLPDGELAEAPLVLDGYLLDMDDQFILLGQQNIDNLELIAINSIVALSQILPEDEVMADPNKPKIDEMS